MKAYHGSPNPNLTRLRKGSWVSKYPYVAEIMGMYYPETGKTWLDSDLRRSYSFTKNIYFKPGKEPKGKPTLYVLDVDEKDIIKPNHHYPREFIIRRALPVRKVNGKHLREDDIKSSINDALLYDVDITPLLRRYEMLNRQERAWLEEEVFQALMESGAARKVTQMTLQDVGQALRTFGRDLSGSGGRAAREQMSRASSMGNKRSAGRFGKLAADREARTRTARGKALKYGGGGLAVAGGTGYVARRRRQ